MKSFRFNKLFIILVISFTFMTSIFGEKFKCEYTFRDQYSLFMVTSKELSYNKLPIKLEYKGVSRSGTLFFNMCEDIQLTNVCGRNPVIGKFIFVDHLSRVGRSKCLIFKTIDFQTWNFKAHSLNENGSDARGGIQIENSEMAIEETEPLTRDILNNLDLGSMTMEFILPEDEDGYELTSNNTNDKFKSAIDRKIANIERQETNRCLLYTSPSPRDKRQSRMPSSA